MGVSAMFPYPHPSQVLAVEVCAEVASILFQEWAENHEVHEFFIRFAGRSLI